MALAGASPTGAEPQALPPSVLGARASVLKVTVPLSKASFQTAVGSGVVVAPGLVATNAHVVMDGETIRVDQNGQAWPAHLRTLDPLHDIALLEVPGLALPPAAMAEGVPLEGDPVFSWSYPGGLGPSLSSGTLGYSWAYRGDRMLQAELEVARGSSGGGLFDQEGRLLGLTTFVLDSSPHSVFAVPVGWIRELVARAPSPGQRSGSRTLLLQGFLEQMSQDPENQDRWLRFTGAWARKAPGDPEAWSAHAQALQSGRGTARAGEDEGADMARRELQVRDALERALALDRNRAVDWHNLGVSLDAENRFGEAAKAFEEALRLRPNHAPSWAGLGCTLFNARDYPGARKALLRASGLAPDNAVAWSILAFSEMHSKQWIEATEHFRVALGLSPFRAAWWQAYGECAARCQDSAALARALARLQELDPKAAKELGRKAKVPR
ncbi:MAG: serine protease [Acidobacteria bacterium]|nr:serine protease [Acidobacteriota bacterium]